MNTQPLDNIENLNATIGEDGIVTITPPVTPIILSSSDYLAQLNARLNEFNQSKINLQAQMGSIDQSIADVAAKIATVPTQ